jgi:hypothetical protein
MSKKEHNSVKMLDRVTSFCLQVGGMMVNINKCSKFQSHMSMDSKNIEVFKNFYADADAMVTRIGQLILIK